jgi:hypothetical protein
MSQRELTTTEVLGLLARHFDLAAKVALHKKIVADGNWTQRINDISVTVAGALPIPPWGLHVRDDVYGDVVIFPDTRGDLHYNGWVSADVAAAADNPTFHSPSGNTLEQMLRDLTQGVAGVALLAVLGLIGWKLAEKHGYV